MKQISLLKSFGYAFEGIWHFFINDRNGKIHLGIIILVTITGFYCRISFIEWSLLLLCYALVVSMEMCNHAIEKLCDAVQESHHPLIKISKDVAAAAVLWSVLLSVIIGMLIFIPKIAALL